MQCKDRYIVCDVETPDKLNSYICSIGLTIVENEKITDTKYSLIKSNCEFNENNVKIHGITKDMVADAPTFFEFWNENFNIFENNIVVAHNASFDLSVIKKELNRNNIELNSIAYIDTLQLARQCLKLEHYGLADVCKALDVDLENHHCALDDCVATAKVLIKLISGYNINPNDFVKDLYLSNPIEKTPKSNFSQKNILLDFFSKCPQNIILHGVTVCLSGDFSSMSKSEFATVLEQRGAIVKKSVTRSLEYLVVGEQGNEQWSHGCFGTKIEKALRFNCSGSNILIVREQDFLENSNMLGEQPEKKVANNNSYIPPSDNWHKFETVEEKMLFLKEHNMLAQTAESLKNIYYNGAFTDKYILCDICGFVDDIIVVIKINDKLHCIDINCLKDMQPTKAEKEKYQLS